ncbi:DUF4352 domain-containing protein [Streptomyces sp. NBC_00140]|uniref:DUF4352 domain-containing protein n=1 Tax=Streptomyces sp. NBC_00140 TaxID=2975664 RepID=UPI002258F091|nr:DUF4352 domain-containing protein [Streptomyces sp. NBC_00140]MCX5336886.1 DUF4352 domain-containing protein [Streptomyces sp. NBC_00140]MCX5338369.1 DUF4352 domain-containing protein [Streptomyces sp. NBC_00140]
MRHTITVTLAACLLATLAACGGSDDDKPTVSKATDTPSAATKPTPSPSPTKEKLRLGDTVNVNSDGIKFSAAALAYKDKGVTSPPGMLQDGQKLARVEVKVCNKGDEPITVTPFVWSLAYEDGVRVEPFHMSGGGLPQPVYPMDAKVSGGDCVRGNVFFEVSERAGRAERVLYSPQDLDEPVEWPTGK